MEFRRSTRTSNTNENARAAANRGGVAVKRTSAAMLAEPAVKPGMRTRGLAIRPAPTNTTAPPAAKQQKVLPTRAVAPLVVRPKNGDISEECDLLTQDFVCDMQEYIYDEEERYLVDELFLMDKKVTMKMRSILIDWIVQVHQRFHLLAETLHLTVYIVDRYLEKTNVDKTELQLVGVCAMLAACKYEETYCPELKDFEFITDNAFSKKQMLRMEIGVVKASGFDLGKAHSIQFLRSFSQKAGASASIHCLAKYLSEMCLVDGAFSSVRPSLVAAGALWLADAIKGSDLNLKKAFSSVADVEFLKAAIKTGKQIALCVAKTRSVGKLKAVTEKYSTSKMYNASSLSESETITLEQACPEV